MSDGHFQVSARARSAATPHCAVPRAHHRSVDVPGASQAYAVKAPPQPQPEFSYKVFFIFPSNSASFSTLLIWDFPPTCWPLCDSLVVAAAASQSWTRETIHAL